MKITALQDLAGDLGKYALDVEKNFDEADQPKEMADYAYKSMKAALESSEDYREELEPMLLDVSEWIGNLMMPVVKDLYLYVYNYSKKKMQTMFQASGIVIEF